MITREQLKVGQSYKDTRIFLDPKSTTSTDTILFIGKNTILFSFLRPDGSYCEGFKDILEFCKIHDLAPVPKKKYWLWDVKSFCGEVFKCVVYVDDDGKNANSKQAYSPANMIRKHESEFIEIEVK